MINYFLFFIFGILPSIVWLLFYLAKDPHPEPRGKILSIFFLGFLFSFVAFSFEGFFSFLIYDIFLLTIFFALIEEFLKFLPFPLFVQKSKEYEEPVDAMIYLITSAMGFSAGENILWFFFSGEISFKEIVDVAISRFLSSTFLHALSSGFFGFLLGWAFFLKNKKRIYFEGLLLATFFHALYNLLIEEISDVHLENLIVYPFLGFSLVMLLICFQRLKKIKKYV